MIGICVILLIGAVVSQSSAQFHDPNYAPGRTVMVHMMEWKWNDIADECERYLGPNGFGGVQVSPVHEHIETGYNSWFERYQLLSYKLDSRSGTASELKSMIDRCNRAGVRIYVDAVFNHMTAATGSILGSTGNRYEVNYLNYSGVPYKWEDFHSPCTINDYNNAFEVRVCQLVGLPDLNQTDEYTRTKIIDSLNELIDLGVAGFRIDAAKHMWPSDLKVIYESLKPLNVETFGRNAKPFIYQEVAGGDDGVRRDEYTPLGAVTEFLYAQQVGRAFKGRNQLKYLHSIGPLWGMLQYPDALVFVDNHDNQRDAHGNILNYKSPQKYVMATAFVMAWPYGIPQMMSSFNFTSFDQAAPNNENGIISPNFDEATGQCTNGWICEHRWPAIRNMVKFRNVVSVDPIPAPPSEPINYWWDNWNNQIAFGRSNRGFIAFNNDKTDLNMKLGTAMPDGVYCDVITGDLVNGKCTGAKVTVENGQAHINLSPSVGVQAIHIESRESSV